METVLSMVVAMTEEGVIGNKGKLPWRRLPSDLLRFKQITMETGVVVMGCKTYESILHRNARPLPDRKHIVLTRKRICSYHPMVYLAHSIEEALAKVAEYGGYACVIGGEQIFRLFAPLSQMKKILMTRVYAPELKGDVSFPVLDPRREGYKRITGVCIRKWDSRDEYETSFDWYER